MKRMLGLAGVFAVVLVLELATGARAQDEPPRGGLFGGPGSNRALIDDTQTVPAADDDPFAAPPDDPFGAPADTLRQLKKVERTVNDLARHAGTSSFDKLKHVHTSDRVRAALATPTKMEFTEMPLIDAVEYLKDYHGIEIQLDNRALEDAGVGTDTPVTRNLNGLPLDASLRLLLGEHELAYLVRDGVLMITTEAEAQVYLELKVYDVSQSIGADAKPTEIAETLALLRQGKSRSKSSEPVPDNFTVVPFRNLLIIRASQQDHEEIEKLFAEIRSKLKLSD